MNLLEALDDPELFGPHFAGSSWGTWRSFLKAWAGLGADMTEAEVADFRRFTGRTDLPTEPATEATLICGRRSGKSRVLALLATYLAAFKSYAPHLAPGEIATVGIIATDRRQARVIFRYIVGLLRAVPLLERMIEAEGAETITLTNRVQIEVATASFRVVRGYSYAAVLADELAFWSDESSANPADEILRAIRPGLASIPGAVLLKASSPYARKGVLFGDYRRHYGRDDARVLVWKAPTQAMNPRIDPRLIEEAYADDPEAAEAEYGAEFRSDLADFVSRDAVDACTAHGRHEVPPLARMDYVAFTDPSGGSSDSFTLAIAHREDDRAVLDVVREVRAPFSPDAVVQEFAAVLHAYGLREVEGDRYGGAWPAERFKVHGIDYKPAEKPKSDLYLALLPLLNAHRAELLDLPRLAAQLVGLERRTSRSGRDSVDHAVGAHDDVANAVAGALVRAVDGGGSGYNLEALVGSPEEYRKAARFWG